MSHRCVLSCVGRVAKALQYVKASDVVEGSCKGDKAAFDMRHV